MDRIYKNSTHVFCHQDLFNRNIVYDGQKVAFVDWEITDYGPAVQDLGMLKLNGQLLFKHFELTRICMYMLLES